MRTVSPSIVHGATVTTDWWLQRSLVDVVALSRSKWLAEESGEGNGIRCTVRRDSARDLFPREKELCGGTFPGASPTGCP